MCPQLRFLTNPDLVGTEKVAATRVGSAFLERPYTECAPLPGKSVLAELFSWFGL